VNTLVSQGFCGSKPLNPGAPSINVTQGAPWRMTEVTEWTTSADKVLYPYPILEPGRLTAGGLIILRRLSRNRVTLQLRKHLDQKWGIVRGGLVFEWTIQSGAHHCRGTD